MTSDEARELREILTRCGRVPWVQHGATVQAPPVPWQTTGPLIAATGATYQASAEDVARLLVLARAVLGPLVGAP